MVFFQWVRDDSCSLLIHVWDLQRKARRRAGILCEPQSRSGGRRNMESSKEMKELAVYFNKIYRYAYLWSYCI